ncbi:hypothetical protein F1737_10290 [Methanoplanus sp. FWC-SCC4]|uniref:Cysteine-rich small domain-containing protein n=1 Tax=Methanochimaera problematica TaxID=2609417 RepID=A0AA97I3T4_9EURY|nr:adenosylcobinamide amidohydrolase [Methanoplanus sp. FWC-SCC4]WOF17038.1 hypothetical protein F1737_10290 [Methanoplanus sp. FWC-SCC4]
MRYFTRNNTLFLRGKFRAASTGVGGGISDVTTIFNHTVPSGFCHESPIEYIKQILADNQFTAEEQGNEQFFGMLTAVPIKNLCVFSYGFITVFITAGVTNPNPKGPNTINIIVHSREGLLEGALLEMIITATEAKAHALFEMGYNFTGTTTDEVVVAYNSDSEIVHEYAGTFTEAGKRVYECVSFGVPHAIRRYENLEEGMTSFFVYSTLRGNEWVEWDKENCPYYPCHFNGQKCDLCYCPFYPCSDESLGDWVDSSDGKKVWGCTRCHLNHHPEVITFLSKNPEATLRETIEFAREKGLKLAPNSTE